MLRDIDPVEFVRKLLADLYEKRFYGSVELKFEHGLIVLIRKTETIRPS